MTKFMQENCTSSRGLIIFLFVCMTSALFMYYPTVASLAHLWIFSKYVAYKHGLILLGIGIYFFYQRWVQLQNTISIQFDVVGFLLLIAASLVWFFAQIAEVLVVQQLTFILILYFILWALMGYRISRQFAFPILLLICAVPVWGFINEGMLQIITVKVVASMLKLIGVNSYIENVRIFIPEGGFSVNPECAGMQQLVAAISLAAIYAYLNNFKLLSLFIYMVLLAVLALMLNILRIFIVVLSGHLTNMQHYFVRVEHVSLGWGLFAVGILIFILLSNRVLSSEYGHFITRINDETLFFRKGLNISKKRCILQLFLVLFGLSAGPLWAQIEHSKIQATMGKLSVPATFGQWHLSNNHHYDYQPFYVSAERMFEGQYIDGNGRKIYCYISYYQNQKQDKELISYLNKVYDNRTWIKINSQKQHIVIANHDFTVNEITLRTPGGKEKLIWYWYYLAGMQTSNKKFEKLLEIWNRLRNQTGASLFLVATNLNKNHTVARKRLHDFLSASHSELEKAVNNIDKHDS